MLCREAYHPELTAAAGREIYRPALWAMPEPLPQKWLDFKSDELDLAELFYHTARNGDPCLLEMNMPDDADMWVADWNGYLKDKERCDFERTEYNASMRRYTSVKDLDGIILPEIICFGNISSDVFSVAPLPSTHAKFYIMK